MRHPTNSLLTTTTTPSGTVHIIKKMYKTKSVKILLL